MASQRFFQFLVIAGATLTMTSTFLFIKQTHASVELGLLTQNTNTYLGPHGKVPGNPQMVRVQVLVNNDPNPQGVQIESAEFNGQTIPLKPRDIYGYRGQASFQLRPGHYKLKWVVRHDETTWPRTTIHEEKVEIDPRDLWIQINIVGENATIS